ncbi:coiled-coil domain-containing protein 172 isoform X2 [Betta splendens]|uniref:Coiled-coil domain-containing protein 172 n=1 Tax=Betta splendens TaxID=158456 RepID=A0A6P7KLW2_BETSP|nr:coiled-coil domain-containing protein 172 isoform X2 [Betta splendens]
MSLDTLFQQILLTEQKLTEQTHKFKEVKVAVIRCNEKLKTATEKYEKISAALDEKAQHLSAMSLQHHLMKKCENQMLQQIEDMLCQKSSFEECLAKIKKESKDEEENFLQEISRFNSDFSLRGNRETVFESQTHTEILDLEREMEALYKEMELMSHRNGPMSSLQKEKKALLFELHILDKTVKDLDRQLSEAQVTTESLKVESSFVSQKSLTDSTCLRLQ